MISETNISDQRDLVMQNTSSLEVVQESNVEFCLYMILSVCVVDSQQNENETCL